MSTKYSSRYNFVKVFEFDLHSSRIVSITSRPSSSKFGAGNMLSLELPDCEEMTESDRFISERPIFVSLLFSFITSIPSSLLRAVSSGGGKSGGGGGKSRGSPSFTLQESSFENISSGGGGSCVSTES